jgi:hypothetical protein
MLNYGTVKLACSFTVWQRSHPCLSLVVMKRRDVIDLIMLAMLWGGFFPFMRVAVREFGPAPLIEMRVAIAALVLTPSVFLHMLVACGIILLGTGLATGLVRLPAGILRSGG